MKLLRALISLLRGFYRKNIVPPQNVREGRKMACLNGLQRGFRSGTLFCVHYGAPPVRALDYILEDKVLYFEYWDKRQKVRVVTPVANWVTLLDTIRRIKRGELSLHIHRGKGKTGKLTYMLYETAAPLVKWQLSERMYKGLFL